MSRFMEVTTVEGESVMINLANVMLVKAGDNELKSRGIKTILETTGLGKLGIKESYSSTMDSIERLSR